MRHEHRRDHATGHTSDRSATGEHARIGPVGLAR